MKLFAKPTWLKPEINEPRYHLHLIVLAAVALGILQLWKGGDMLTFWNVLVSWPLLLIGDVIAHTLLQLN